MRQNRPKAAEKERLPVDLALQFLVVEVVEKLNYKKILIHGGRLNCSNFDFFLGSEGED